MIVVHHLNNSRSQRVLWLLEELGIEYRIEKYQRDAASFLHSDGTNQLCLLRATRAIASGRGASEYGF